METPIKKKAVIYCRVSTKEQVEEGNSLITQERQCTEYAQKHGYEVVATFIEQGESAKTADRTELKKMMGFCSSKKNSVSAIIAYKIDRISRNTDDYSQIRIALKRYGVEIKSTSEHFEDTPAGRFMENIIANVAQFDNDVRTERSVGGMKEAVREGRYVWLAPYGYSNVKISGKANIAPNESAKFVLRAFIEVSKGVYTINTIREQLVAEGMVTPKGKPISKTSFSDLLRNELYVGWINKFGERTKGIFEPIVNEQLFKTVQQTLSGKNKKSIVRRTDSGDFPLRRLFKHPSGRVLTGGWSQGRKKKYAYYLIHGTRITIRKEVLEKTFKGWLNKYFKLDSRHFKNLLYMVNQKNKKGIKNKQVDEVRLKEALTQLQKKQNTILEKNINGVITDALCKTKIAEIDKQIGEINDKLLQLSRVNSNDHSGILQLVRDILLNPATVWEKASIGKRIALQRFYFPQGIEFDGITSRTTKVCCLYKAKKAISPYNSLVGDYPEAVLNTDIEQIIFPWQRLQIENPSKDNISYDELFLELDRLGQIFNEQKENTN